MVKYLMGMKEEWKFASKDIGEQFVMIRGIIEMLKLSVDNLDSQPQVQFHMLDHTMVLARVQST
jgi:hypothetical protein